MAENNKISYVEFPAINLKATKKFFNEAFGWTFTDYGEEYTCFFDQGINGGFYRADIAAMVQTGSALIILYSEDLEATREKVVGAGGRVVRPIFSFPGGRRFHFTEPSGNELAVWSDFSPEGLKISEE